MAGYSLTVSPTALAEIAALEFPLRRQINHAVVSLAQEPRPARWEPIADAYEGRIVLHGRVILYAVDDERRVVTIHAVVPL